MLNFLHVVISFLSVAVLAYDLTNFPVAASGNATLTKLLVDGQTLVNASLRGKASAINDWTSDNTGCISSSQWALTYDDGPSAEFTPQVLADLAQRGLKATFFVIGANVVKNPQILIDTYKAGHTIGIHTWNHDYLTSLR